MVSVSPTVATPYQAAGTASSGGLKKNYLSFSEIAAQSIGTIAPSGTPGLVISVVFATAANGTWLAYVFATLALLIVALQINVFATRVATPRRSLCLCGIGTRPVRRRCFGMGASHRLRVHGRGRRQRHRLHRS